MICIDIAVPERCSDCPCHDKTNDRCQADYQNRFCVNESNRYDCNIKPTWCPIINTGKAAHKLVLNVLKNRKDVRLDPDQEKVNEELAKCIMGLD